ncbi:hypothetical protein EV401DRAFT_1623462 [Pisolithus croceorrhizus]|nr:hypothetical protein EV401DRAFT_1623462 [Pisolithus croceorrhizus]
MVFPESLVGPKETRSIVTNGIKDLLHGITNSKRYVHRSSPVLPSSDYEYVLNPLVGFSYIIFFPEEAPPTVLMQVARPPSFYSKVATIASPSTHTLSPRKQSKFNTAWTIGGGGSHYSNDVVKQKSCGDVCRIYVQVEIPSPARFATARTFNPFITHNTSQKHFLRTFRAAYLMRMSTPLQLETPFGHIDGHAVRFLIVPSLTHGVVHRSDVNLLHEMASANRHINLPSHEACHLTLDRCETKQRPHGIRRIDPEYSSHTSH